MSSWTTMQACAKEPFFITYSDFYATHGLDPTVDAITSSVWTITGGTGGTEFIDGMKTGIFLSGGTQGGAITAKNVIEISGGQYRACETITVGIV